VAIKFLSGYDNFVKTKPLSPFDNFTRAVDHLIRVPHSEIKKALEQEKKANADKPKRGPKPKHSSSYVPSSRTED
jgi:hypothetical protein